MVEFLYKGLKIMYRLKNKVALITGGARGLGASIASYFFNEGANVILCDVNINDAKKRAKELNGSAYYMDVSDSSNVVEIFKKFFIIVYGIIIT